MNYKVYPVIPELKPFIKCFWSLEDEAQTTTERQRILPDGCMEMIFHLGDPYLQHFENQPSIVQPRAFVFGQITKFIEIEPTGATAIIAARFHPAGLYPFSQVAVADLTNKAVELKHIFGDKGLTLESDVFKAADTNSRIQVIGEFLLSLLSQPSIVDAVTRDFIDMIFQLEGRGPVAAMADSINVNRRQVERRFQALIGMSPKQLLRVTRLQATLRKLEKREFTNLTDLAYENGYFDQAHFVKDFKEFTGSSPKFFYANNLRLAAFFASVD